MKSDKYSMFFNEKFLMGPNSLRLLEELTDGYEGAFEGKRVMDLGCGQGITSLYVAKETKAAQIFAVDLWISANDMKKNFEEWGISDRMMPIHADANELPFADETFDVITTVDSYHYFGAKEGFFAEKIWPLVKKGGYFMMCVPGIRKEFGGDVPEIMTEWAGDEVCMFHSCEWWEKVLTEGLEDAESVKVYESGAYDIAWDDWFKSGHEYGTKDKEFFDRGIGEYLNFVSVVIRKK